MIGIARRGARRARPAARHSTSGTPEATSRSTIRGSAGFTTAIWQLRAAEDVAALVVLGADPHLEVVHGQLHVAAVVAARLDHRCHFARPSRPFARTFVVLQMSVSTTLTLERCLAQWAVVPTRLPSLRRPPIGFAHRGARAHAPENTLEAFALALRLGATGLESDVWLTADGEAVLDHDGVVGSGLAAPPIADVRPGRPARAHPHARRALRRGGHRLRALARREGPGRLRPHGRGRPGGGRRRARPPVALPPRLAAGGAGGGTRARRAPGRLDPPRRTCPTGPSGGPPRWPRPGIDAVNLHHTDWTGGLTTLFHRFERAVLRLGRPARAHPRRAARRGHRRRLQRPRRPHGRRPAARQP